MEMSLVRDGLAAGGLLAQHGDVHVAEIGERQGARDRGCGHDQDVDGLALGAERQALVHAEAMLLVHDRDAEIVERDAFLEQRMGADRDLDAAVGEPGENGLARDAFVASRQQRDGQARPARPWARGARNAGGREFRSAPSWRPAARPRWRSPW